MIRKIKPEDFLLISRLVRQVHDLHYQNRPDIYNDIDPFEKSYFDFLLTDEQTIALVYEKDDEILGFAITTLRNPSKNPLLKPRTVAFVEDITVDENHRRLGIGKSIFDEIAKIAKQMGADAIELMLWDFNDTATTFYKELGFGYKNHTMEKPL